MTTTEQTTKRALWIPGWYELDQPLFVADSQRLWFYQQPPAEVACAENIDFVFFNQLSAAANCQVRIGNVLSIRHPELGELTGIETDGLDYTFRPVDRDPILVNAEEDPGRPYDSSCEIEDWTVEVILSEVSEPIVDDT